MNRRIRLGAVGYLNARPLVYGLDRSPLFETRLDVPAECAALLHAGTVDVGLIPSIEYLRGDYRIVPDLAIASRGPVLSVALFTKKPMKDVRSIAMDASSRTSVALVRVLCARAFKIEPAIGAQPPDLRAMLADNDAALIIGDNALLLDDKGSADLGYVEKVDLGDVWTKLTGLPFVWAVWVGRTGALGPEHVTALQQARDAGVQRPEELAREYFRDAPALQPIGAAYLRDNIKYGLAAEELQALELFYRYAAEAGVVGPVQALRFF